MTDTQELLKKKTEEFLKEIEQLKKHEIQAKKEKGSLSWTKNDTIRPDSSSNVAFLLENDSNLKGMFRFNEFTQEIDVVKSADIELNGLNLHFKAQPLSDIHEALLSVYFSGNSDYQVSFSKSVLRNGISSVAAANSYHPLKDYFKKCRKSWDGKKRIDTFFQEYLGCADTEVTRLIADLFFRGVVAKGTMNSVKYDYVLDLVGSQGCGKTTLLRKITPLGFYTDSFVTFVDRDDLFQMKNAVIINDDEMTASACMTSAQIKKFVTTESFSFRPAYHEHTVTFNKRFVITRTSNHIQHLQDKTGERRFLPLLCNSEKQIYHPVQDLTQETVDQLWGEAAERFAENKVFDLNKSQVETLNLKRENFMLSDELLEAVDDLLNDEFSNQKFFSKKEFYSKLMFLTEKLSLSNKEKQKIIEHLLNLGYEEQLKSMKIADKWRSVRGFKKEN